MGVNFDWNSRQRGKAWPKGRRATTCHAGNSCEHVHKANSWRRAFYREDRHRCLWRTATDFRCDQKIDWSTQGPLRRFTWPTQRFVLSARRSRKAQRDRKSTRLNSSHTVISYAVFCLKKKKKTN